MASDSDIERRLIAQEWSLTAMDRAFRDLATAFGSVDAKRADDAVWEVEKMLAAEFEAMLKEPPEGVSVAELRTILANVMPPFLNMTRQARDLIQRAGKPKN